MRTPKGDYGYLKTRKVQTTLKTILEFSVIAALLILGYTQTGSKKNLLTIVAIVGCLPASKAAVQMLTILPYQSLAKEKAEALKQKAALLTVVFDTVLTSRDKIMPVDCFVISGNTICGYTSGKKTDPAYAAGYLKEMLQKNGFEKVSVKIFPEYKAFVSRAEGMNKIASVDGIHLKDHEERLKSLLLNLSM